MSTLTKVSFTSFAEKATDRIRARFILFYGDFVIEGFRVVDGSNGLLFVGMPCRQEPSSDEDGHSMWRSRVFLPDPNRRKAFEEYVLKLYRLELKTQQSKRRNPAAAT